MKAKFLIGLPFLWVHAISAQITISPGAQFSISGNMQLTLQNTNLVNNGNFAAGNSMIVFTGNAVSSISGSQPTRFSEIEINKTNGSSLQLLRTIDVTNRVLFTSGFLNLNGFNTDLGTSGHLDGEQENTRITGANGGEVLFNVGLNNPTGSNPANLGVFITANQDLGNVIIRRGHKSQLNAFGAGNSILRYYDILPANNANLNATLQFRYFDGELNGLAENSLIFFESQNTINWTNLGITSRDVVLNFAEKTGINSFGRFTLSSTGNALPVHFVLFNARCETGKLIITWKISQEQNSSHFDIEKSTDGIQWTAIGNLPAAGNSGTERTYSFTDNLPSQNSYYRIAQYDLDGRVQYTPVLRASCNAADAFSLWPNPVRDRVFINIVAGNESPVIIKLFDSRGALVKMQKLTVLRGSNQFNIDMGLLANGIYSLQAEWNNGQTRKTAQVMKQ